jgi:HEPN domain-containing protein
MTPPRQAAAFVAKADEDLHVLTVLCPDAATTDAIWGFHAQQAAEKRLKAQLAFHGIQFPFTHRLLELADLLADAGCTLDARFEPLLDLTPYAVELRYSTPPTSPAEPPLDRPAILRSLTELRQWVKNLIGLT